MTLSAEIKKQVDAITTFYSEGGIFNIAKYCEDQEIEVLDVDFVKDELSGAIFREDGKWTVYINEAHSLNRKRFTICHELGHYISMKFGGESAKYFETHDSLEDNLVFKRDPNQSIDTSKMEIEANKIAAELLMPKEYIEHFVVQNKDLEDMAEYFGVSESAMGFRMKSLGYNLLEESV